MRAFFPALVLLLVPGTQTWAEDPAPPSAQDDASKRAALVQALQKPARQEAAKACAERALQAPAADALVAVQALRQARGPRAVDGLVRLVRHRERAVRNAAWEGIGQLALRRDGIADLARRELLVQSATADCEAIAAALGRVGDARHVPALFEVAARENAQDRKAAFGALREMAGVRLPDRLGHWMSWWRLRRKRGNVDLRAALEAIESGSRLNDSLPHRIVLRDAWFDVPLVRDTVQVWLRVHDDRLRGIGARLVAELRLGDLIDEVESVGRFADSPGPRQAAADALKKLEVPPSNWRKALSAKQADKDEKADG